MLSMPSANQGSRDTQSSVAEGPVFPPGTATGLRYVPEENGGILKDPWWISQAIDCVFTVKY
jgi:hypothetical protein